MARDLAALSIRDKLKFLNHQTPNNQMPWSVRGVFMTIDKLRLEAQSVLDDLWSTKQIPFELTARTVDSIGMEEYIIRFYDSRLHSVDVSWKNNSSFKDAVRSAVLGRAARISGPLSKGTRAGPNAKKRTH